MSALAATVLVFSVCLAGTADSPTSKPVDEPKTKIEFRRAEYEPAEGLTEAKQIVSNTKIYMYKTADLTNEDIAEVRKLKPTTGYPGIEITFTKEGAKKMEKLTAKEQLRKPMAILVNGKMIMAPRINAQITDKCVIDAAFTNEELEKIVKDLGGK